MDSKKVGRKLVLLAAIGATVIVLHHANPLTEMRDPTAMPPTDERNEGQPQPTAHDVLDRARPHLVLVHSFPTNSILLSGLAEFLQDFFEVHFVDLPGFTKSSRPLDPSVISVEAYAAFLDSELERLALDSYVLGGVSFGFLVVNAARADPRCKAILAMEPFLGIGSLRVSPVRRATLRGALKTALAFKLPESLWKREWFRNYLSQGEPKERMKVMFDEIDPGTFFATADLILGLESPVTFRDVPYLLLINPDDQTVNSEYIRAAFSRGAATLVVVETSIDHYPQEVTKRYFSERITKSQIEQLQTFLLDVEGQDPR